jgi:hypothetical protein
MRAGIRSAVVSELTDLQAAARDLARLLLWAKEANEALTAAAEKIRRQSQVSGYPPSASATAAAAAPRDAKATNGPVRGRRAF